MVKNQIKYSQKDRQINAHLYKTFLKAGIDDGWNNKDKYENFQQLITIAEITNHPINQSSCLDVGCGTGDFAGFLKNINVKEYSGIDIFEPAVSKAREKYPNSNFIIGDFLDIDFPNKYDFVFCSGALTTSLDTDNYLIMKKWVKKMYFISNIGCVFNVLLLNYKGQWSGGLFLYERPRVLEICAKISSESQMQTLITDAGTGDELREMHVFLYR